VASYGKGRTDRGLLFLSGHELARILVLVAKGPCEGWYATVRHGIVSCEHVCTRDTAKTSP
jgi:hypothetical protein